MQIIKEIKQRSDEWYNLRMLKMTASNADKIITGGNVLFNYCEKLVNEFINDIKEFTTYHWDEPKTLLRAIEGEKAEKYKTPNGYAVVVNHGFDTRDLLKKWKDYDITLKRDELLFLRMEENK